MSTQDVYGPLAAIYDDVVVEPVYEQWARFLDRTWRDDAVATVLDLCCGTGRLCEQLMALGYDVVGVDASASMLHQARERLGPLASLAPVSLPGLVVASPVDAVVSTYDSMNYLPPDALRSTIGDVASALRPQGWFVFDVHSEHMFRLGVDLPETTGEVAGVGFTMTTAIDLIAGVCDTRIEVQGGEGRKGFVEEHRQYIHTEAALRRVLDEFGFDVVRLNDEYTDAPADARTLRTTWVTRLRPNE